MLGFIIVIRMLLYRLSVITGQSLRLKRKTMAVLIFRVMGLVLGLERLLLLRKEGKITAVFMSIQFRFKTVFIPSLTKHLLLNCISYSGFLLSIQLISLSIIRPNIISHTI